MLALTLPAGTCPPRTADDLWRLLADGGGSVEVTDSSPQVRAAWRRLLHAVKQRGEVPAASHLLHRGRDGDDLTTELRPGVHPSRRYRSAVTAATHPESRRGLSVPGRLVRPHFGGRGAAERAAPVARVTGEPVTGPADVAGVGRRGVQRGVGGRRRRGLAVWVGGTSFVCGCRSTRTAT